jgi:hypothetical protein
VEECGSTKALRETTLVREFDCGTLTNIYRKADFGSRDSMRKSRVLTFYNWLLITTSCDSPNTGLEPGGLKFRRHGLRKEGTGGKRQLPFCRLPNQSLFATSCTISHDGQRQTGVGAECARITGQSAL